MAINIEETNGQYTVKVIFGDKGDPGDAAPILRIQYSSDGLSWHDTYQDGDTTQRQSTDGGVTWSDAIPLGGVASIPADVLRESGIIDDLTSILNTRPLSANQGRVLKGLIDNINTILTSDDTTLDEIQELVNYIKQNRDTLDTLSIANIAGLQTALDNLTTNVGQAQTTASNADQKAQGHIDNASIHLTADEKAGIAGINASDPVAKQSDLPDLTADDVGKIKALGSISEKNIWEGTQAEYDALGTYDPDTIYLIDGSLFSQDIQAALEGAATPSSSNVFATMSDVSSAGGGDMMAATYDPTTVSGDAFSMGNMAETATAKVLTDVERINWNNKAEPDNSRLSFYGASELKTGAENFIALQNAISAGIGIIVVDGFYDLEFTSTLTVLSSMSLIGLNDSCGFNVVTSGGQTLFVAPESSTLFMLQGLKLQTLEANAKIIYSNPSQTSYVDTIRVENCEIIGGIRIFYLQNYSETVDPTVTPFGIGNLIVENNKSFNTTRNIFYIEGACKYSKVSENVIKNMSGLWFAVGVRNGVANEVQTVNYNERLIARNNIVINGSSWQIADTAGYISFILWEGVDAVYSNNHVEGLWAVSETASLYDSYFNAKTLLYENNTYKNNSKIGTSLVNKHLIKSKESVSNLSGEVKRIYRNNAYLIEESWISDIGRTLAEISHVLFDLPDDCAFEFVGNKVDVIGLIPESTTFPLTKLLISDNSFNFRFIAQSGALIRFDSSSVSTTKEQFVIENNKIVYSDSGDLSSSYISLFRTNIGYTNKVFIKNNTVVGDVSGPSRLFYNFIADKLVLENNNFIVRTVGNIFYGSDINEISGGNNQIESLDRSIGTEYFVHQDSNILYGNSEFEISSYSNSLNGVYLPIKIDSGNTKDIMYLCCLDIESVSGQENINFGYNVYHTGTDFRIKFLNSSGVFADYVIDGVDGDGSEIYSQNGRIRFYNSATTPYIYIDQVELNSKKRLFLKALEVSNANIESLLSTAQQAALNDKVDKGTTRTVTASFTVQASDAEGYIRSTAATAINATVEDTLPMDSVVTYRQAGAGIITLVAGVGVTLNGDVNSAGQHSTMQTKKVAAGVYDVIGGVA